MLAATLTTVLLLVPALAVTGAAAAQPGAETSAGPAATVTATKPLLTDVKSMATDGVGYCALLTTGGVDCWGLNSNGELGNGTTKSSAKPVKVSGLTNATAIAGNAGATEDYCAVLRTGGVDCWGSNNDGALGNGAETDSDVPVAATGITDAKSVDSDNTGSGFCAVLSSGGVDCWGINAYGELGDGSSSGYSDVPVRVTGITDATALAGDFFNFCALLSTGKVDCWGMNEVGELGNATTTNSDVPVVVRKITDATSLTDGNGAGNGEGSYCALLSTGGVDCWGDNYTGQLGNGRTTNSDVPVIVKNVTNAISLSNIGNDNVNPQTDNYCAVLKTKAVDCWGYGEDGELGNGTYDNSPLPVATGITNAVAVNGNFLGHCAVLSTGRVDCWGYNEYGELGDATTGQSDTPVAVKKITDAVSVLGDDFYTSCAVLSTGGADCWGLGYNGELGNGRFYTTGDEGSLVPVAVLAPA